MIEQTDVIKKQNFVIKWETAALLVAGVRNLKSFPGKDSTIMSTKDVLI